MKQVKIPERTHKVSLLDTADSGILTTKAIDQIEQILQIENKRY